MDGYTDDFFFELPEDEPLQQQTADTNQTHASVPQDNLPVRNDFSPSPDFKPRLPKEQKKPQTTPAPSNDQQTKPATVLNPSSRHDIFQ